MKKEASQTMSWLWELVRNPDVVWLDGTTKEEVSRERMSRYNRFHIFRPMWMYTFATTNPGCGCRRRFGLWCTLTCSDHVGLDLNNLNDEEDS